MPKDKSSLLVSLLLFLLLAYLIFSIWCFIDKIALLCSSNEVYFHIIMVQTSHVLCKHSNGERSSPANFKSSIGS